ncbi:hypothetical protein KP509_05G098900 [Ceratopteris richardii]|uniref:YEATS domain-containing protein n=1 Tax=Ceratopteris richardii TaxID=49495 RepID=A0A8T2UW69_CERRI|nr:hypothetical protein KP509_05G098900 [Ceratopteris richardii]
MELPVRRMKDVEISVPIAYGTIAYWLGKKADEYRSHRWIVYVRSISNEDLGPVIKRVIFTLHPSFPNPTRIVDSPPFELTEVGWGEFEIGITMIFQSDAAEKPIELYHHLKLYPDDDAGPPSMKKPVVVETYDEIVFSEPSEAFVQRIRNHPSIILSGSLNDLPPAAPVENSTERKRGDTKDHPQAQWFMKHSDLDELARLKSARQQVQSQIMKLKRDLNLLESEALQLKASSGMKS